MEEGHIVKLGLILFFFFTYFTLRVSCSINCASRVPLYLFYFRERARERGVGCRGREKLEQTALMRSLMWGSVP